MRLRRSLASALGVALALSMALAALTAILYALGSSGDLMLSLMERYAPSESTGLPKEDYPAMVDMITGYLSGRVEDFQYPVIIGDNVVDAFHDYEQKHMADCRALFALDITVLLVSLMTLAASAGGVCFLRRDGRYALGGFLWGTGGVILTVLVLIVWGLANFDGLFVLFHRLSFDNSLWLLDPRTDLLIRLMPTAFFTHYAVLLGGTWLGFLCLMAGAGLAVRRAGKRRMNKGEP